MYGLSHFWTVSPGSHQKWQWLWKTFNPQGNVKLLVRPITRGLAVRLTADGEAVQTIGALGTSIFTMRMGELK